MHQYWGRALSPATPGPTILGNIRTHDLIEAFMDPQMWCYCLIAICTTLPTSGLEAFANTIISGFHFSVLQTQLLAMVLGALSVCCSAVCGWSEKQSRIC
jgi:hypothetical protein